MTTQARLTPEAEHLAEQERLLEQLTEQLTAKEAEFAETGSAFARFRSDYLRRFGPLYGELDRLEAEIARRVAEHEETPAAWAKANEAAARADESQQALAERSADPSPTEELPGREAPTDEARSLYRDAAKRIHPDLAMDSDEKERRHILMAALDAAYADGDVDAMRRIIDGEDARPEAIVGDDVGARLMRAIRRIAQVRGRFSELDELTEALRSDPLFILFEECQADWSVGLDPFADDEAAIRERIANAHAVLAALAMDEGESARAGA